MLEIARFDYEHRSDGQEGWDPRVARIQASSQVRKSVSISLCY